MFDGDSLHNTPERFHIYINILSFEESGIGVEKRVETSLFVVKGNPLMISPTPLACFASGINSLLVDIRPNDDISTLFVQAVITNLGAHMAVPLDELLEYSRRRPSQGSVERTITMWDTQTGRMRGTALVQFRCEKEEPHSYSEIISIRKSLTEFPPPMPGGRFTEYSLPSDPDLSDSSASASRRGARSSRNHSPITSTSTPGGSSDLSLQKAEAIRVGRRLSEVGQHMPVVPALDFASIARQDTAVSGNDKAPIDEGKKEAIAVSPQAKTRKRGGVQGFAVPDELF
jgi:hypothetical protein